MSDWAGFWIGLAIIIAAANISNTERHDIECIKAGGEIDKGTWIETPTCVRK